MTIWITPYHRTATWRGARLQPVETPVRERSLPLSVDVKAVDDEYEITALVPGLQAEDLEILIQNDTLTLKGEFKSNGSQEQEYLRRELPTGRFSRTLAFPAALEANKAEASLKDGVLNLRVPKAEAERRKSIKVKTG